MLVFYGLSSFNLDWLRRLAEKRLNFSENKTAGSWCLFLILLAILGLLHLAEKNRAPSSNGNEDEQNKLRAEDEEEPGRQEIHQNSFDSCESSKFSGDRTAKSGSDCAYCGNFSSLRCSRCKAARYCSEQCQIGHWRAVHKYECVGWNASVGELGCRQRREACSAIVSSCYAKGCAVCGGPTTTCCSRCRAVRYCSPKCLIEDWPWHKGHCSAGEVNSTKPASHPHEKIIKPQNLREEEDAHSNGQLSLEYHICIDGTTNNKSLVAVSQEPATKERDHTTEWMRCYENELAKSRNEITLLKSERDKWAGRANFAREKYRSFKKEFEQQLFVLKHEKELILNAERQARNTSHSLSERLYHLQIVVQESIAAKRKQEEYIQILESEWAQTKKELQEERGNVQKLAKNLLENAKAAESRAAIAEARLHNLERKIKLTNDKVPIWTDITGRPVMTCAICLNHEKDLAFGCGHMTCRDCGSKISRCPICREQITSSVRLFPG